MPKHCCVENCKSNYDSQNANISVYRLPKDTDEKDRWISSIPRHPLYKFTSNTVVCQLHWPTGFATKSAHGKQRPVNPPSIWPGIPSSNVPTPMPAARPTAQTSASVRSVVPDELPQFLTLDTTSYQNIIDELTQHKRQFSTPVITFVHGNIIHLQAK